LIEVVGHTAIDHICRVSHLPAPNSSAPVLDRKIFFGGGAANIAAGIATLGGKAALISAVGGDFAGSVYETWMNSLGIDKRFFVVPEANTPTAFMFTDEHEAQMTFFEWGASRIFETAKAPSLTFAHMATADPAFNLQVAKLAKFCSFDPGQDICRYTAEHLTVMLKNIDILIANQHEYAAMCQTLGISHDELTSQVPLAIETRSSEGSLVIQDGKTTSVPAISVVCQDPTGAGDGFRAGFLTAYAEGHDPITAVQVGTVTASYVVEHAGCQTALANRERMLERYTRHFGALPEPGEPRRA
jgi:ribokinase